MKTKVQQAARTSRRPPPRRWRETARQHRATSADVVDVAAVAVKAETGHAAIVPRFEATLRSKQKLKPPANPAPIFRAKLETNLESILETNNVATASTVAIAPAVVVPTPVFSALRQLRLAPAEITTTGRLPAISQSSFPGNRFPSIRNRLRLSLHRKGLFLERTTKHRVSPSRLLRLLLSEVFLMMNRSSRRGRPSRFTNNMTMSLLRTAMRMATTIRRTTIRRTTI